MGLSWAYNYSTGGRGIKMAQIITAPNIEVPKFTSVFLAGGITNCKEWQKEVIERLQYDKVSIFNPRQEHFDISDKNASYKQILWEFERLEKMDIFSMYFCNDNSDQPICMYELGRNISNEDLENLMNNAGDGNEINFDTFSEFMKSKFS